MMALVYIALVFASIAFVFWQIRFYVRSILHLLQFNTAGSSPMQRLVPNVSYFLLFLLLLGLAMG